MTLGGRGWRILLLAPSGIMMAFSLHAAGVPSESQKITATSQALRDDALVMGRRVFLQKCVTCHQGEGDGSPDEYPPLAGAEIVQDHDGFGENHLARIVLNGLVGPVTVRGITYNGAMPPWKDELENNECAALLTYLRQAWGNQAPPISAPQIAILRLKVSHRSNPWTIAELKAMPPELLPVLPSNH